MTTTPPIAGILQMAAALAFHLPGARLDLSSVNGVTCSVGPLTDPRCILHPAEFRDLVVTTGGVIDSTVTAVPATLFSSEPSLSLTITMPGVQHIGGGLYRIVCDQVTSYAFVTPLLPAVVDAVMTDMQAELPVEYQYGKSLFNGLGSSRHDDDLIAVNLIQDEGLGVTMVMMHGVGTSDEVDEEIAHSAVAACLVAELEYAVRDVC